MWFLVLLFNDFIKGFFRMVGNSGVNADRKLSVGLIIGIVLLPIIFAWFTLKDGYSKQAKIASFGWLAVFLIFGMVGGDEDVDPQSSVVVEKQTREEKKAAKELLKAEKKAQAVIDKNGGMDIGNAKGTVVNGVYIPFMPESTSAVMNIDKGVYVPYDTINNKQIFDQYGSRMQDIQPLRRLMAERAILGGKCEKVTMSEVKLDEDANNLVLFVWCINKDANEVQIYASESDLRSNAPLLSKDEIGLSDSDALVKCERLIKNDTKGYSKVKIHSILDSTVFKTTQGTSTVKIGLSIVNDVGVKIPYFATCSFDINGNNTYYDRLRGSRN